MAKRISDFFISMPNKIQKSIQNYSENSPDRGEKLVKSTSKMNTVAESPTTESSKWYEGSKLDTSWLLQTYSCFQKVKLGKRFGIKYTTCFTHIQEAQKCSKNG